MRTFSAVRVIHIPGAKSSIFITLLLRCGFWGAEREWEGLQGTVNFCNGIVGV